MNEELKANSEAVDERRQPFPILSGDEELAMLEESLSSSEELLILPSDATVRVEVPGHPESFFIIKPLDAGAILEYRQKTIRTRQRVGETSFTMEAAFKDAYLCAVMHGVVDFSLKDTKSGKVYTYRDFRNQTALQNFFLSLNPTLARWLELKILEISGQLPTVLKKSE